MTLCYERDAEAPRDGCRCRQCYDARERALDPELIKLVRGGNPLLTRISFATEIVHQRVIHYCMGLTTLPEMHLAIIASLVQQNDKLADDLCSRAMLSTPPIFLLDTRGKNPWTPSPAPLAVSPSTTERECG